MSLFTYLQYLNLKAYLLSSPAETRGWLLSPECSDFSVWTSELYPAKPGIKYHRRQTASGSAIYGIRRTASSRNIGGGRAEVNIQYGCQQNNKDSEM
jgi:hypothetical protein